MKSIKEKAEEYGYANWQSDEYHDGASEGLEFDPIGHTQKTFEAGANYVLECLERAIELNESTFVYSSEKYIKVEVLNKLIEQLNK